MNSRISGIGMTSRRTRERLVQRLREKGIGDERVLDAILNVPRHLFIDEALATRAYEDTSLPIGHGQTISQPYTVARMTQTLLQHTKLQKVLEVGTGSGYQTAVLSALVPSVYSVERIPQLWSVAKRRLHDIGANNVQFKLSDGSWGWEEHAPYDGIIVTAAAGAVPAPLLEQLAMHGRMVLPVGRTTQELLLVRREPEGDVIERLELAKFVPLVKDYR